MTARLISKTIKQAPPSVTPFTQAELAAWEAEVDALLGQCNPPTVELAPTNEDKSESQPNP